MAGSDIHQCNCNFFTSVTKCKCNTKSKTSNRPLSVTVCCTVQCTVVLCRTVLGLFCSLVLVVVAGVAGHRLVTGVVNTLTYWHTA